MTVIRRTQQRCEYPSNNPSDVESLDIQSATTSDTESVASEVNFRGTRGVKQLGKLSEEYLCRKGYLGRRKRRLVVNNGMMLQTLAENEDVNTDFVQLMESYKTPFERLMENESALRFWNEFNEMTEENQNAIINSNRESRIPRVYQQEDTFPKISSKVKRAMKIKKNIPFEVIEQIEKSLLEHFERFPADTYSTSPKNSYERLMLHAIAEYHNLLSIGMTDIWPPCIQVFTCDIWTPTSVLFCDTVKQLRK